MKIKMQKLDTERFRDVVELIAPFARSVAAFWTKG